MAKAERTLQGRQLFFDQEPMLLTLSPTKHPFLSERGFVRTLRETGKCAQAAKEMKRLKLSVMGMCETRWNTFGEIKLQSGETLLYSGKENEDDLHEAGVALLLSPNANQSLIKWEPISERIISAHFESKFQKSFYNHVLCTYKLCFK